MWGSNRKQNAMTAVALFAATVALYVPSLWFDFVRFDDYTVLLAHPKLYSQPSFATTVWEIVFRYFPREEPLIVRDLSWAMDSRLFGFRNPFGYHLGNVLLNGLNTALVYCFLLRVSSRASALCLAGLFAVLPVHVEAVAWVMGRKDVLSTAFVLLILNLEAAALSAPHQRTRIWMRMVALALYPLAILSKFSAVTLVAVLAVLRTDWPHLQVNSSRPVLKLKASEIRRNLLSLAPHAAISGALFVWYSRIVSAFGVISQRGPSPWSAEHLEHLAWFSPLVVGKYLCLIFWPSNMSIWYTWPHVAIALTVGEKLLSFALALGLIALSLWLWRTRPRLFAYWLMFALLLLPYMNVQYIGIWVANRYVYLASLFLLLIGASLFGEAQQRLRRWLPNPRLATLVGAGLITAFGLRNLFESLGYMQVYRNNEALWSYEVNRPDPSVLSYQGLAREYRRQAQEAPLGPARGKAIAVAASAIEHALVRIGEIPWQDKPNYLVPEIGYHSNLLVMRGQVQALRGVPLGVQLESYRAAYKVAQTPMAASMAAEASFQVAQQNSDRRLAEESLGFYRTYVELNAGDPAQHAKLRDRLDLYRQAFPELANAVERILLTLAAKSRT